MEEVSSSLRSLWGRELGPASSTRSLELSTDCSGHQAGVEVHFSLLPSNLLLPVSAPAAASSARRQNRVMFTRLNPTLWDFQGERLCLFTLGSGNRSQDEQTDIFHLKQYYALSICKVYLHSCSLRGSETLEW